MIDMADSNLNMGTHGTYMLSTVDNPFSPFTQFKQWFAYDTSMGYHSAGFLARVAATSDELSEADQAIAIQSAIDEIVRENVSGMWIKVKEDDFDSDSIEEE